MTSLFKAVFMTSAVMASLAAAPLAQAAPAKKAAPAMSPQIPLFGVNLASAEFGGIFPGTYGLTYIYPPTQVLDYYHSKGRTLIRLPFKWERMQRSLNGPLDALELMHLKGVLRDARERRMKVILDVHNYGRYYFPGEKEGHIIGTERVPVSAYADLWRKIALAVKDETAVYAYGLMNEPHDLGNETRWPVAAQAAINAIREVDSKTLISLAGDNWSSSRNWRNGPNETLNEKVRDAANNMMFEAHCYFDKDNSGSYKMNYDDEGGTPDGGVEYVRPFVEWCKEKGVRGFVGEYGVPDTDTRWLVTMDRFMAYLQANNISSAYWAGGPWWGNYAMSIEPRDARSKDSSTAPPDRPQMLIMRQYPG
jgi:endoglucanase